MNVRDEREAAGISQAELARCIGMLQPKLSRIENGHVEPTTGEEALIRAALQPDRFEIIPAPVETEEPPVPHLAPYPAAPTELGARKRWVAQRNRNFQQVGVKAPESGTHGPKKKQ